MQNNYDIYIYIYFLAVYSSWALTSRVQVENLVVFILCRSLPYCIGV